MRLSSSALPDRISVLFQRTQPARWSRGAALGVVLASSLLGACATQAQTGQLLSAVGTAALIAGAVTSDDGCSGDFDRSYERGVPCRRGSSNKTGAILAATGLGVALVGNALQEDAARLDARRRFSQGPTYTPAMFPPPPGFAPAGTFQPFPPAVTPSTTAPCQCATPTPPPCTGEATSATPGNPEPPPAAPAACPCSEPGAALAPAPSSAPEGNAPPASGEEPGSEGGAPEEAPAPAR
jgi:hypothetical protein